MDSSQYQQYKSSDMILRDHLAIERTALANERTLLAYVRTMIGIVAVGGTLIKLFEGWEFVAVGWVFICLGFFVLLVGFSRYLRIESLLLQFTNKHSLTDTDDKAHQLLIHILDKLHLANTK